MNRNRIMPFCKWLAQSVVGACCAITSTNGIADTNIAFTLPSGVQVEIIESNFQRNLFKVPKCQESKEVCLINGHVPFGVDVGLPKTYVKSIRIAYLGQLYLLDTSDMYNAWGTRPLEYKNKVRYFGGKCFDAKNCQFRGLFSDAAGSYVAEWRIVNGLPIRTILTSSNDIVDLFIKHIDPPEFD